MKKIVYLFYVLLLIACQAEGPAVLKGKIDMGSYTHIQLFVKGVKVDTIHVDEQSWTFEHSFALDSPQIVNLFGMVGNERNCFPVEQAFYIQPGEKYELKIGLKGRGAYMTMEERGMENKAMIAYNCFYADKMSQFFNSMPTSESFQDSLYQIYSEGMKLIDAYNPDSLVRRYLEMQAYLSYFSSYDGLASQFVKQKIEIPLRENIQLPSCEKVLDHPIALKFYDLRVCIFNQLIKKATEPEEQIRLLNEWFQTEAIREEIRRYICLVFLDQTFCQDENYARLKKISEGLADQEKMLKAYQNKRFATVGAPCPDVQFEDQKGQVHHLSEFKGKYVYLNLWASWCKSCSEEFSYLKKLAKELKNSPIVFVSISVDSDRDVWLKKVKELGLSGNQWIVTDKNFLKMLGVKEVPHSLLYSKEGTLLQYKAPRPSSEEALNKILSHLK